MLSFAFHGLKKIAQFVQIFHILKESLTRLLLWMEIGVLMSLQNLFMLDIQRGYTILIFCFLMLKRIPNSLLNVVNLT